MPIDTINIRTSSKCAKAFEPHTPDLFYCASTSLPFHSDTIVVEADIILGETERGLLEERSNSNNSGVINVDKQ